MGLDRVLSCLAHEVLGAGTLLFGVHHKGHSKACPVPLNWCPVCRPKYPESSKNYKLGEKGSLDKVSGAPPYFSREGGKRESCE